MAQIEGGHGLVDIARVVLVRLGAPEWTVDVGDFWCTLKPPGARLPGQGWKLHVSATQLTAPVVLSRVAELLVEAECAFKFARGRVELGKLLSNRISRGSGGKFITVYPLDDDQFRTVVHGLDEVSEGLGGPRILSDRQLRPGSSVYYRYGVISSPPVFTNDGLFTSMLSGPNGELMVDERRPLYSPPEWATPPVPVDVPVKAQREDGPRPVAPTVLIADRFAVRGAIRHSYRGGVFRAVDRSTGESVVLKQARRRVLSSRIGTDASDLLRHEARMLDLLGPLGLTPRKIALVEHQDSEYLAQEEVAGETLHTWVAGRAAERWQGAGAPCDIAVAKARQLVDLVAAVHERDVVLCDFKPHNVMVTPEGELRLIDLEAATRTGALTLSFATPGYAAPEQAPRPGLIPAPSPRADLFGLGATILYLASGVDPVFAPDEPAERRGPERRQLLLARLGRGMASVRRLAPLVTGLMADEPDRRWDLDRARAFLVDAQGSASKQTAARKRSALPSAAVDRLVRDALRYTTRTMTPAHRRLWTPGEGGEITEPCCVQHGSSGVLGVLTRAAQVLGDGQLRDTVATVARWTDERYGAAPRILPGLYFGSSGPAWALHDAAMLLGDEAMADRAIAMALRVPLRWPNVDVCHGTAGAGMTQLHLWGATGDARLRSRGVEAADEVLAAAREVDGQLVWPIPETFESNLAGQSNYGFAHGVAGIGAFLLAAGLATGQAEYLDVARRAGETLVAVADVDGPSAAAWWRSTLAGDAKRRVHWCHGSSGVGTFLIRLWAATGEQRFRNLAEAAGSAVYYGRWYTRNAACHGLAGDGEFLLDLAHFTKDKRHRDRAWELAAVMDARHTRRGGLRLLTDAPDDEQIIVDYNTGLAGAAAFLLRLRHGGPRWWMLDDLVPGPARDRDAAPDRDQASDRDEAPDRDEAWATAGTSA